MQYSPWKNTNIKNSQYLDLLVIRPVPASANDQFYTIQLQYHLRPDLLAYDLYNSIHLWWIFAQRNMDIIQDPIYDFTHGTSIYLPSADSVRRVLG